MDSDEFLDYWEEEGWDDGVFEDPTISLYALPLVAIGLVSLGLIVLLAFFARGSGPILSIEVSLQAADLPAVPGAQAPSTGGSNEEKIAPLFTSSVRYWEQDILAWAAERALDPNLAATVMQIESCGDPEAVSSAGAEGLFQVMPFHFQPGDTPTDPATNAARGLAYLVRSLEAHNGDIYLALAGYNAGIGGSQRAEAAWPQETKRYTYWGSGIYDDARLGKDSSARLDEWLAAGGAGLCHQAEIRLGITP